jgi:hypothetical protein
MIVRILSASIEDLTGVATTFYMGKAATVVPIVVACTSFISSAFIILIAWKSGRNTSYHRIMCFMSAWEMVRSLCIAMSTLPMPKDVIYPYYGQSFGNVKTCEAQAFLLLFGGGMTISTSVFLNLYYLLTIRYYVKEETLKKYLEPIFLIGNIAVSLVVPVTFQMSDYLNPTPYETSCAVGPYPFFCDNVGIPCTRGEPQDMAMQNVFRNFVISFGSLEFIIFTVSMVLIISTFYKSDRELARRLKQEDNTDGDHDSQLGPLRSRRFMTKIIAQQAFMYFSALVLTWIFLVLSFFQDNALIAACKQIFVPLRGTLNMIIFVHHKVYAIRISDTDLSYFQALMVLLHDTKNVPENRVSNIEMVSGNSFEQNFHQMYKGLKAMRINDGQSVVSVEDSCCKEIPGKLEQVSEESVINHFDVDEHVSAMTCHEDLLLSVNEQLSTASGQKSEFQELYGEDIESVKTPHD